MSDKIKRAQIMAGEELVIDSLRERGLLPPAEPSALDEARAIIAELVACKDLKEWIAAERHRLSLGCRVDPLFPDKWDEYERRQPLAWEAARAWDAKQK